MIEQCFYWKLVHNNIYIKSNQIDVLVSTVALSQQQREYTVYLPKPINYQQLPTGTFSQISRKRIRIVRFTLLLLSVTQIQTKEEPKQFR